MNEIKKLIEIELEQRRVSTIYEVLGTLGNKISEEAKEILRDKAERGQDYVDKARKKLFNK